MSGLSGQMDPTTEAYAASYELRADALALQGDGIADPPCYRRARSISLVATSVPMSLPPTILDNIADITGLSACIVGCERSDHVEYCGSVAPDDYQ